jgi:hypothetical protein
MRWLAVLGLALCACGGSSGDEPDDPAPATGGASSTGGSGTGGATGGASATGGSSSGGVTTGGAAPGGAGGRTTGGAAPGGAGAGGAATGGAASGGGGGLGTGGSGTAGAPPGKHQFSIQFDYRFDANDFFADDVRKRAIEAAAKAWSSRLQDDFEQIPAGFPLRIRDLDMVDDTYEDFTLDEPIDDLVIFVACSVALPENVAGRTRRTAIFAGDLGVEFAQELADRWSGPDQQPWTVAIAFSCVDDYFWFDPTPETGDDVPVNAVDFISTATHEIGHALGIGGSDTYEALVNAELTFFEGPKAMTVYGGPVPLVENGGLHFAEIKIDDLEPLMSQGTARGMRHRPGRLDFAALEDIGYEVSPQ